MYGYLLINYISKNKCHLRFHTRISGYNSLKSTYHRPTDRPSDRPYVTRINQFSSKYTKMLQDTKQQQKQKKKIQK